MTKEITFEKALEELEKIVEQLESGDLPLEKSLELFETGVKLSRSCRERLANAERRIELLSRDGDGGLTAVEIGQDEL
ncbi:MAG: exodeoxyribonuclease VII small subunit [Acidobacteria bacterium]|nr:exodeoxyribonuclease VII small subunit [Acidobacteriota bacterium]MCW5949328.1 exodeoxyribonuclease VII small subunit [Pyrinomonadaceae bacterium]